MGKIQSMKKEKVIEKSLVEQILENMFRKIEKKEEFDKVTIQKLKRLSADGELKKSDKVVDALRGSSK